MKALELLQGLSEQKELPIAGRNLHAE